MGRERVNSDPLDFQILLPFSSMTVYPPPLGKGERAYGPCFLNHAVGKTIDGIKINTLNSSTISLRIILPHKQ